MLIAGVDDAGRGAVIGPLVIAGVLLEERNLPKLVELNVKDSKLLSPHRREELAEPIKKLVIRYHVEKLLPAEIDEVVNSKIKLHKLNRLEAKTMAKIIETLKPDVAYVDASDILEKRFGEHIQECLTFKVKIISEHEADRNYPIVSAASIIAKTERDKTIAELAKKFGEIGSGYPSDPITIKFLEEWLRQYGSYPNFVRESWKPAKRLKATTAAKQMTL